MDLVLFDPPIQILKVQKDAAVVTNGRKLPRGNHVLQRFFRPAQVGGGFFHRQQALADLGAGLALLRRRSPNLAATSSAKAFNKLLRSISRRSQGVLRREASLQELVSIGVFDDRLTQKGSPP